MAHLSPGLLSGSDRRHVRSRMVRAVRPADHARRRRRRGAAAGSPISAARPTRCAQASSGPRKPPAVPMYSRESAARSASGTGSTIQARSGSHPSRPFPSCPSRPPFLPFPPFLPCYDRAVRIGIDARKLHDFGIGTYIRNLLRQLARLDRDTEFVLLSPSGRPRDAGVARRELPAGRRNGRQLLGRRAAEDSAGAEAGARARSSTRRTTCCRRSCAAGRW